jgi:hypothetical protein
MGLKLYQATGNGQFLTLAGVGIMIDFVHKAIEKVGADPNDVVLRLHDGSRGASVDIMFPTPHTFLFDSLHIDKGNLCFTIGGIRTGMEENNYELPLANPSIVDELVNAILKRAKKHRKTKSALNYK